MTTRRDGMRRWIGRAAMLVAGLATLGACGAIEPRPVQLGAEECAECRMVIDEPRFVAQALTTKGRAHSFDSVECLAAFVAAGTVAEAEVHSLWVADFAEPERWVAAEEAVFLRSPGLRTPMGGGLSAHADAHGARAAQDELGGEVLRWAEVLRQAGEPGAHAAHAHPAH